MSNAPTKKKQFLSVAFLQKLPYILRSRNIHIILKRGLIYFSNIIILDDRIITIQYVITLVTFFSTAPLIHHPPPTPLLLLSYMILQLLLYCPSHTSSSTYFSAAPLIHNPPPTPLQLLSYIILHLLLYCSSHT
jgi:hypothetical protein